MALQYSSFFAFLVIGETLWTLHGAQAVDFALRHWGQEGVVGKSYQAVLTLGALITICAPSQVHQA